ncbi:bifunctional 3-deoxy-7-phosphoheptulonate synthase/chorismate mutase type II [Marnyiella aurantia]|uniref:chorismate mutase n=1 Tax=Marnyiella aurantia TaxID=2758037 RepID=A0A7D7QFC6_9FLAO|nr:chorismate mutase [Marnyiella aurantia]MBA5245857.1 bifunctional 3-deoxy-7-phosphoheptulonate synthase/chorismate mutase type II [Marnyiella aurantia]QMS98743.1 bifunctional 3-deoxy-7-phosphoheptulonate synthase/chorismate mutase type II [Marnyiella aurantia]
MQLTDIKNDWISQFNHPLVIAGPCSAESETQMLETAARMKEAGAAVPVFRAGIWKPRTKPNGFEGVGSMGLGWLRKVKQEFGYKTATEVANMHHVQAALEADVDVLWIGARTTVNPFAVQEIANALQGTDRIVLVKNPVNPDLALWIGALERLAGADIHNLGAIHRGFSTYRKTNYRNIPNWQIALDFKNQLPNIPLIIDPSHICGNRTGLSSVAQEALNLGYQGVMIETHCNPDEAWSDARQQITPETLASLLSGLVVRNEECAGFDEELERYRTLISDVDYQVIDLLSQRMKLSEKIGMLKSDNNLTVFQPDRWKAVTEYAKRKAEETGMSQEFIESIFKTIHEQSVVVQNDIMKSK